MVELPTHLICYCCQNGGHLESSPNFQGENSQDYLKPPPRLLFFWGGWGPTFQNYNFTRYPLVVPNMVMAGKFSPNLKMSFPDLKMGSHFPAIAMVRLTRGYHTDSSTPPGHPGLKWDVAPDSHSALPPHSGHGLSTAPLSGQRNLNRPGTCLCHLEILQPVGPKTHQKWGELSNSQNFVGWNDPSYIFTKPIVRVGSCQV